MNSLLGMRLGQASSGLALAFLGAAAACSSSSNPVTPSSDSGLPPVSDGGPADAGNAVIDGPGAACTPTTEEWVGAFITLNSSWAEVEAANGGTGPIYLWTLAHYNISGSTITGTTLTCGTQTPPLVLNATGAIAVGATTTGTVQVLFEEPTKTVWDKDMRTAMTGGTLGGWNVGSSTTINLTTSVQGLAASSQYANPTTAWPSMSSTIPASDIVDDDNDGNPGITTYPLDDATMGYYLPATGLGGGAPKANKLFIVSRTQLSLYGTSSSCTAASGTVTAPEYEIHVVGCQDVGSTTPCMPSEWQFLDENVTVYSGAAGKKTLITGTYMSQQLGLDGGTPTCDDVVAAFPDPMPQPPLQDE